jgi:dipeptidyl aminopeptidase/acylaminoacyl peptidase
MSDATRNHPGMNEPGMNEPGMKPQRSSRGAVAVVLLAALFIATAVVASSSAPSQRAAAEGTEATPEVLARYAPPALPADLSRRVQAMFDARSPGAGQLTPDGRRLFFNWSVTGTSQVWRIDGPQRFPVQMTGGEDPTQLQSVMPDGRHIVVSRDRGGAENPGLYLQPAEGGPLETIFQKDGVRAFLGFISDDGASIYYTANDRKPDSYAVYRYDVAARRADLVFGDDGLWSIADLRPDGRLLLSKATGNTTSEYSGYDPATQTLTPFVGQGEQEDYQASFGMADDELIVRTPKLGDFQRLYRYGTTSRELTPITPEMASDVDGFSINRNAGRILYTVNEGGYTRPNALDARTFAEVALPSLPPGDHVYFGSTTRDGRYTAIVTNRATSLPSSAVLDWSTGQLTSWHAPSAPEIDPSRFASVSLESYPARDGTRIPMFVRRPPQCGAAGCPVIVEFHGGPEAQALPGWDPGAQLFVDAGFIHVTPNVRGSDGYGKAWLHADNGPKRLQVITDIEDCARFIRSSWAVNGAEPKIGITGASYGGYSTLVGMTMFAGAYDAGVSVVGMSNLTTFLNNTAAYRRSLRITEYGDPARDADALRRLSPVTFIDQVEGPLLIIQGANDPRVPVSEALQMKNALDRRQTASQLILFGDEGHGSQRRDNRVQEVGHTLRFFTDQLTKVN